jgi:hypothetical protein
MALGPKALIRGYCAIHVPPLNIACMIAPPTAVPVIQLCGVRLAACLQTIIPAGPGAFSSSHIGGMSCSGGQHVTISTPTATGCRQHAGIDRDAERMRTVAIGIISANSNRF